jgi:peptidoglycan/LPS O-acetylase OafA/YrhL
VKLDQSDLRKAVALLGGLALVAYLVIYVSQTYLSPLGYATYALLGAAGLGTLALVAFAKREKFGSTEYRLLVIPVLIAGLAAGVSINFFGDHLTVNSPEEQARIAWMAERDASSHYYTEGINLAPGTNTIAYHTS